MFDFYLHLLNLTTKCSCSDISLAIVFSQWKNYCSIYSGNAPIKKHRTLKYDKEITKKEEEKYFIKKYKK